MEKDKDYIKVDDYNEIPPEWKEKLDGGEAVAIEVGTPRMTSFHLTVVFAILVGLSASLPMLYPSVWFFIVSGLVCGIGVAFAYMYYKVAQIAVQYINALQFERAASNAILTHITKKINEVAEGTSDDESCLNKDSVSSGPEQTND